MKHLYICDTCKAQFDDFHECDKHEKMHRPCHYKLQMVCARDEEHNTVLLDVSGKVVQDSYLDDKYYGVVWRHINLFNIDWEVEFARKEEAPEMLVRMKQDARKWLESVAVRLDELQVPEDWT